MKSRENTPSANAVLYWLITMARVKRVRIDFVDIIMLTVLVTTLVFSVWFWIRVDLLIDTLRMMRGLV